MSRVLEALERAGGSNVWVKARRADGELPSADADWEAVAATPAYDTVLAAVLKESEAQGLDAAVDSTRQAEGRRAADIRLSRRAALVGAWRLREVPQLRRATIVIDDLGEDLAPLRRLLELPYPLTFSVLPHLRHSTEISEAAHRAGREVMLHLPMQPESGAPAPGPGEILVSMSSEEVARTIDRGLDSVPYAVGVNNHEGSNATADARLMAEVMAVLSERRLYFVDSRTTASSVALELARRQGLPAFYRSVFLDDTETVEYSLGQLRVFRRRVEQHGAALAIGHPYPSTLDALAQFAPEFERDDIELVPASELVRLPEVARLSPPRPAAQ